MIPNLAILGNLNPWEILIILFVILLLFGSAKIPALMRSMGSGISQFKKGLKDGEKEAEAEARKEQLEAPKESPVEPEKK